VHRSISLMVPAAVDPDNSWLLHLLAISLSHLPRECGDSRDDQDSSQVNCDWEEWNQPQTYQKAKNGRIPRGTK
jgi:hypothetical protein